MRKITLLLSVLALVVALSATAAYALVTITGDSGDNILRESPEDDIMYGRGGVDVLEAFDFSGDRDELRGGAGNDNLDAEDGDGDDFLYGGRGNNDVCEVGEGDVPQQAGQRGCEVIQ
jgi:RTX calcium-binding nonapeptide repeat (4 copies)